MHCVAMNTLQHGELRKTDATEQWPYCVEAFLMR